MTVRVRSWNPFPVFVGGVIAIAIGLAILFLGYQWRTWTQQRIETMVTAQGTVVEVVARTRMSDGERKTSFYPIVEFRTAAGDVIRFESSTGSNPPSHRVGETVNIFYNPQTPQDALIDSWDLWIPSTIVMGVGSVFALIGGLAILDALGRLLKIGGLLALLGIIFLRRRRTL